ncbi:MAG: LysR substrate-binding domain-containing protein [Cyanobacteria bacterium P01_G01_bin.54]
MEQWAEKAIAFRTAQTGQVRIATIRSLATHWLPPIVAQFNQQFPQVTMTLTKHFDQFLTAVVPYTP